MQNVWGLIFGARVGRLDIQPTGGSVHLTKTNTLITLAPYFFPFYTMLLVAIRLLLGLFLDPAPYRKPIPPEIPPGRARAACRGRGRKPRAVARLP